MNPRTTRFLCNTAGDGGAGGGKTDPKSGDPQPVFSKEQLEAINQVVSSHVSRVSKGLGDIVSKSIADTLSKRDADAAEAAAKAAESSKGQKPDGGAKSEAENELARLRNELKNTNEKFERAEKARAEEARLRRQDAETRALSEALVKGGIQPALLAGARHVFSEKLVREGDVAKYRAQRAGYHDDLDIEAGVAEWLKSDEGKAYLPPRPAGGSGGPGGNAGTAGGKLDSKQAAINALNSAFGINGPSTE